MNILEKRKIKSELYDIVKNLEIFNTRLKLAGSASLRALMYYGDYDFNCKIRVRKPTKIYNELKKVLSYTNDKLYFIEFKIEYMDYNNQKIKLYHVKDLKLSMFKNIKFIKVDYIVFLDFVFKELSIMYIFKETNEDRIKTLTDDYNELKRNGENFKALKRKFSIYKIQKDYPNIKKLTSLFNSKLGKLYEMNSNLKTIELLKTMYDDPLTLKRIEVNLKFLRIDPNTDVKKIIKENDKTINDITVD